MDNSKLTVGFVNYNSFVLSTIVSGQWGLKGTTPDSEICKV